jgi:hypothetical protein
VRFEWLSEFYRVRGDFAHGRLTTRQPMVWNATEHLALAAIAFPFVVRCLLQRAGAYTLTRDDIAAIETFEPFADQAAFLLVATGLPRVRGLVVLPRPVPL